MTCTAHCSPQARWTGISASEPFFLLPPFCFWFLFLEMLRVHPLPVLFSGQKAQNPFPTPSSRCQGMLSCSPRSKFCGAVNIHPSSVGLERLGSKSWKLTAAVGNAWLDQIRAGVSLSEDIQQQQNAQLDACTSVPSTRDEQIPQGHAKKEANWDGRACVHRRALKTYSAAEHRQQKAESQTQKVPLRSCFALYASFMPLRVVFFFFFFWLLLFFGGEKMWSWIYGTLSLTSPFYFIIYSFQKHWTNYLLSYDLHFTLRRMLLCHHHWEGIKESWRLVRGKPQNKQSLRKTRNNSVHRQKTWTSRLKAVKLLASSPPPTMLSNGRTHLQCWWRSPHITPAQHPQLVVGFVIMQFGWQRVHVHRLKKNKIGDDTCLHSDTNVPRHMADTLAHCWHSHVPLLHSFVSFVQFPSNQSGDQQQLQQ